MSLKDPFHIDLSTADLSDPEAIKAIFNHLCNLVEALHRENLALKEENQKLKDEINRLKGEKGRPNIKPKSSTEENKPVRKPKSKKKWKKRSKIDKVVIDESKVVKYEGCLPGDARHKGYRSVIVQDIAIKTNNIEFKLERYYSPSEAKTYEASLPDYIKGEFGPSLKSWVLFWYFHSRIPENRIHKMLSDIGIIISAGEISNIILKEHNTFHKEKKDIAYAGIKSSSYQHIDDTGARVGGDNCHFTVLCNDYYSAYFINPKKNRLTVIGILSQKEELFFMVNPFVISFLRERKLKAEVISSLKSLLKMGEMTQEKF